MKLEQRISDDIKKGLLKPLPGSLQGVSKKRISFVLQKLARGSPDQIDTVFALLDNQTPSWFSKKPAGKFKFADGASTGHIACHVGIYQRGGSKLDREGRDYFLKPLWEIGALEKIRFDSSISEFLDGHAVAKSPNSAYRIGSSFLDILKAPESDVDRLLNEWGSESATRARLQIQAMLAESSKKISGSAHDDLISSACKEYVPRFLPGYQVVYIDAGDGERVNTEDKDSLAKAGLKIELADSMPDVLLWNPIEDSLWVIEAVCSDGEVDLHKVESLNKFMKRNGKKKIGFTTAYRTWREAAARQGKHKNIAPETCIWIEEDGTKQFTVETFKA